MGHGRNVGDEEAWVLGSVGLVHSGAVGALEARLSDPHRVRFAFYKLPSSLLDILGKWNLVFMSLS